jgi:hypothetical protein
MSSGSPSRSTPSSTPSQTPPPPLIPTWLIVIGAISITIVIIVVIVMIHVKPVNQGPRLMSNNEGNEFYHTNEYSKIGGYFYF